MGKPNQKSDSDPEIVDGEMPKYKEGYRKYPSYQDYNEQGQGNPGYEANINNDRGYSEYR